MTLAAHVFTFDTIAARYVGWLNLSPPWYNSHLRLGAEFPAAGEAARS